MKLDCSAFDSLTDPRADVGTEERAAWQAHLGVCASCREQVAADTALRSAFAEAPAPALSPGFMSSLRRRVQERRLKRQLSKKARTVLLGYLAFALASSAWILAAIDWAGTGVWRLLFGLAAMALAAAPLVLLGLARGLLSPRPR